VDHHEGRGCLAHSSGGRSFWGGHSGLEGSGKLVAVSEEVSEVVTVEKPEGR